MMRHPRTVPSTEPRGDEQSGNAGQPAAQCINPQFDAVHAEACQQSRAFIAADGIQISPEARLARHHDKDAHQHGGNPDGHRRA